MVSSNICAKNVLEVSKSKWDMPPKLVENDRAKNLWYFQSKTNELLMADQSDIVVVNKLFGEVSSDRCGKLLLGGNGW